MVSLKGAILGVCCALGYATVGLLGNVLEDEDVSLWVIMCLSGWANTVVCFIFFLIKSCRSGQRFTAWSALGPKKGFFMSELMALFLFGAGACDLSAFDTGLGIAIATAIDYLSTAWTVIFSGCFLHEKITRVQVTGVVICLVGTTGVAGVFDSIADDSVSIIWEGVGFAVGSSIFLSALLMSNVRLHKIAPEQTAPQRSMWMFINRAVLGTVLVFAVGAESDLPSTMYQWALMVTYCATILVTSGLMTIATKFLTSSVMNVLMTLEVFFTLIYQLWVFDETPGTWAIVCIFVQVFGVILAQPKEDNTASESATASQSAGLDVQL